MKTGWNAQMLGRLRPFPRHSAIVLLMAVTRIAYGADQGGLGEA